LSKKDGGKGGIGIIRAHSRAGTVSVLRKESGHRGKKSVKGGGYPTYKTKTERRPAVREVREVLLEGLRSTKRKMRKRKLDSHVGRRGRRI